MHIRENMLIKVTRHMVDECTRWIVFLLPVHTQQFCDEDKFE
jgi:hypothetical protein